MRILIIVVSMIFMACGSTLPESVERTLPDPIFFHDLPEPPDEIPDTMSVVPVDECVIEGSNPPEKTSYGIYMSEDVAMGIARLKVAYDEMRGLYAVDLQTMDREREFYERYLEVVDDEIDQLRQKARRSWWEEHGPQVMLGVGVFLGVGVSVGIAAALDGVTD